jgi:RNA polymerase sigma-70 factor, ECF subfamily
MFAFLARHFAPNRQSPVDSETASARALDAFQSALATHGARWYSACLRITQNPTIAEDALQDALLKAWSERACFRHHAALDTWLHRIAVNCAIDQLRARRKLQFGDDELTEIEPVSETFLPNSTSAPEAMFAQAQLQRKLASALKGLTHLERVCFELKHREQWRLEEIATRLDISLNSTKQALFRALRKLRLTLADLQGAP